MQISANRGQSSLFPCINLVFFPTAPASAVSLVNGTLGGFIDFYQFVYWNAPLEWRFGVFGDDAVVAVRPFYDSPYCYPNYRGRCELSNEGALRLNNLTYADQGQYVFIVGAIHPYTSQTVYFRLQIFRKY